MWKCMTASDVHPREKRKPCSRCFVQRCRGLGGPSTTMRFCCQAAGTATGQLSPHRTNLLPALTRALQQGTALKTNTSTTGLKGHHTGFLTKAATLKSKAHQPFQHMHFY